MMKPVILVEGFGRCGTSMVMRMLDVGGVPCIGDHPGYEDDRIMLSQPARDKFYQSIGGNSLKLLDPQRFPPPPDLKAFVIWLDRDPIQQAKSALNLMSLMLPGMIDTSRQGIRKLAKSYQLDRPRAHKAGLAQTSPLLKLRFEDIIEAPVTMAEKIGLFLAPCFPKFDAEKAAAEVHRRSAFCLETPLELSYA
jgi:hypothetical protein